MLRVITANLNGIRAATKKGFFDWLKQQAADFICIQELKAQQTDLTPEHLTPHGYQGWFQHALKKGYSGVGIYSRHQPDTIIYGFGSKEFDDEGRYVELRFNQFSIISVYVPSGSSSPDRQSVKFRFMDLFMPHLAQLSAEGRKIILAGDINIAHNEIDLKNWRGNLKSSGFLPEERAWLSQLFNNHQYVDAFRQIDSRPDQFTWWSQRGQAYANNVGWRIDYQLISSNIAPYVKRVEIYKEKKFSDHAPLIVDYANLSQFIK